MTDEAEVIAAGRLALLRVREGEKASFDDWIKIGRAVRIGRIAAMAFARVNHPKGSGYARAINGWLADHQMGDISRTEQCYSVVMADNAEAIAAWLESLKPGKRRRFTTPVGYVIGWQTAGRSGSKPPRHQVKSERPAWKPKGAVVSFPQDMIKRAAMAMRERWTNDTLQLARIALEAAIRTEADLQELIPQPKPAKPAVSRGSHGFDVHSQPAA